MGTIADEIKNQIRISKIVVSASKNNPNRSSDFVSLSSQDILPEEDGGWTLTEAKLAHAIIAKECEAARLRDGLVRRNIGRSEVENSVVLKDYDTIIAEYEKKVEEERSKNGSESKRLAPEGTVASA